MLATYSGSKAFVSTFTSALAEEVKAHNITVQHLNTYFVVRVLLNGLHRETHRPALPDIKNVQDLEIDSFGSYPGCVCSRIAG